MGKNKDETKKEVAKGMESVLLESLKNIRIRDYIFNDDGNLEFRQSDVFNNFGVSFIFSEEDSTINMVGLGREIKLTLSERDSALLLGIQKELTADIVRHYKDILTNNQKLICFESGLKEFPLIITTKKVIEFGHLSPKYIKGLEFALSDAQLKRIGIEVSPGFKDVSDIQKRLGKHISKMKDLKWKDYNNTKCIAITLKEALDGFK